jgi:hypothetical protein
MTEIPKILEWACETHARQKLNVVEIITLTSYGAKSIFNTNTVYKPILTHEGVCFPFNLLPFNDIFHEKIINDFNGYKGNDNKSDWNPEAGFLKKNSNYPMRPLMLFAFYCGSILLHFDKNNCFRQKNLSENPKRVSSC